MRSPLREKKETYKENPLSLTEEEAASLCDALKDKRTQIHSADSEQKDGCKGNRSGLECLEATQTNYSETVNANSTANDDTYKDTRFGNSTTDNLLFGYSSCPEDPEAMDWLFDPDRDIPVSRDKRLRRKRKSADQVLLNGTKTPRKRRSDPGQNFNAFSNAQRSLSCPSIKTESRDAIFEPFSPASARRSDRTSCFIKKEPKSLNCKRSKILSASRYFTPIRRNAESISLKFNSPPSRTKTTMEGKENNSSTCNATPVQSKIKTPQCSSRIVKHISPIFKAKPFEGDGSGWRSLREINKKLNPLASANTKVCPKVL
mmetsp:Transcript_4679/g.5792  ORF Transcript_4679/g.5792 Transcript_4679/m.5792 type:complete len:317 (+) Transcript_4679:112-1062(+)